MTDREPAIVEERSHGVKGVSRVETGVYCLSVEGLTPDRASAVVSVDTDISDPALDAVATVELHGSARACGGKFFEIATHELRDGKLESSDRIGFTVLVG